jgi:hypothetical protein
VKMSKFTWFGILAGLAAALYLGAAVSLSRLFSKCCGRNFVAHSGHDIPTRHGTTNKQYLCGPSCSSEIHLLRQGTVGQMKGAGTGVRG